jgi:hypothetical protein
MHTDQSHGNRRQLPMLGLLAGVVVAAVALLIAGVVLARVEGDPVKALVPVWLWSMPWLSLGAGAGWLAGMGAALLGGRQSNPGRGEMTHTSPDSAGLVVEQDEHSTRSTHARDRLGTGMERLLDSVAGSTTPVTAAALGVAAGLGVVVGGLAAFVVVWAVLVHVVR